MVYRPANQPADSPLDFSILQKLLFILFIVVCVMTFKGGRIMRILIQLQRYLMFDSLLQLILTAHYNKLCVKCMLKNFRNHSFGIFNGMRLPAGPHLNYHMLAIISTMLHLHCVLLLISISCIRFSVV